MERALSWQRSAKKIRKGTEKYLRISAKKKIYQTGRKGISASVKRRGGKMFCVINEKIEARANKNHTP